MTKKDAIARHLSTIYHTHYHTHLADPIVLKDIYIANNDVTCVFTEPPGSTVIPELTPAIESTLFECDWVDSVQIQVQSANRKPTEMAPYLDQVTQVIAVSSCKGGVGKSTIALNLATALHMNGAQVGVLDADIHGPSLPTIIQPTDMGATLSEDAIPTFINNGIRLMSYGYVQPQANQPAILRGPIASNVLKQLAFKTDWGHLDYLIIDCPPGTGDILLTISQDIQLSGALIVTTPHALAYADVVKGIEMFKKVKVPILGIIENMSYFICDHCDERHYVYGQGGLQRLANDNQIDRWYSLPISKELAHYAQKQLPFLMQLDASHPLRTAMKKIANDCVWQLADAEAGAVMRVAADNDGGCLTVTHDTVWTIPYESLRARCTCAYCVDEMTQAPQWDPASLDPAIIIASVKSVGHYGQAIEWLEHGSRHASLYTNAVLQEWRS